MPYENEIPDDLRALCRRNALEIGDRDFDHHMQQLIGVLQRGQASQKNTPASKSTVTGVEDILPPPFEWIEIPAGVVVLEDASQGHDKPGTKGGHFPIPTFAIAKYPITNSQYHAFVEDGYGNPKWWDFSMEGKKWREEHAKPQPTAFDGDDLPRTNVSWYDAVAFCRWLSSKTTQKISLPTEQQWLRAAQGDDNRKYPWGEKRPNELLCNWAKKVGHPTPVMQYPQGISPFGVMDMSGNVWEWCLTEWGTDSTTLQGNTGRLLKGGCWYHELTYLFRAAERTPYAPNLAIDIIGFRIARTL
jgi:formylglycine-generating enzyme required for sulfatase activity